MNATNAATSSAKTPKKKTGARKGKGVAVNPDALPSVLAFRRCLEIGDAAMRAVKLDGESMSNINVYEHGKRTTAAYNESKDPGKANDKGDDSRNLVYGCEAKLPSDCETLAVDFRLTVLPINTDPDSCDKPEWMAALSSKLQELRGGTELAAIGRYYAYNLANGSWLWRNRDVAESVQINIRFGDEDLRINEALDLALRPVLPLGAAGEDPHVSASSIDALADAIAGALAGVRAPLALHVGARVKLFPGQAVWPSQLYIPGKPQAKQNPGFPQRQFFMLNETTPAISAEKIGNALRTYDRTHGDSRFPEAIIPVEPKGGSLKLGVNLRSNRTGVENTAFALLPRLVNISGNCAPLSEDEKRYLLGCLIRGGLYGASDTDDEVGSGTAPEAVAAPGVAEEIAVAAADPLAVADAPAEA